MTHSCAACDPDFELVLADIMARRRAAFESMSGIVEGPGNLADTHDEAE